MKILFIGEIPEEKVYQATCVNCNSVIQFEQKEARLSIEDYNHIPYLKIECPVCTKEISTRKRY